MEVDLLGYVYIIVGSSSVFSVTSLNWRSNWRFFVAVYLLCIYMMCTKTLSYTFVCVVAIYPDTPWPYGLLNIDIILYIAYNVYVACYVYSIYIGVMW